MRENFSNFNNYPHTVFASVVLLDGKIINFKIGNHRWTKNNWISNRQPRIAYDNIDKIKVRSKSFKVTNDEQHHTAFTNKAQKFYKQFELYEGYNLARPY